MFFNTWWGLGRVLIVGTLAYAALIIFLRFSGKRTLSKMNAFDLVVTVALGSILATILLSKDVALAEGLVAFGLLISLQFIIAWLSIHVPVVRRLVKSEPTLLFYQGEMLESALNSQRVVPEEVRSAIRSQGIGQMSEVEAVILETDGSFSVVPTGDRSVATALSDVKNYPSFPDNDRRNT